MSGETDLGRLLAGLAPRLEAEPYGFVALEGPVPAELAWVALVREAEGLTVIAPQAALAAAGIAPGVPWARITLEVHSALEAVGLTAAVSAALGGAGIPANMVAGYFHDHLFVPWERRQDALARLEALRDGRP
jgi:hypothetical protein